MMCVQLLSIRQPWSLKIPLWCFGICTYCAGSSTCGGESFDNIELYELSCYDMVIDHILSIAYGMGIAHGMSIAHIMSIAHSMSMYDNFLGL